MFQVSQPYLALFYLYSTDWIRVIVIFVLAWISRRVLLVEQNIYMLTIPETWNCPCVVWCVFLNCLSFGCFVCFAMALSVWSFIHKFEYSIYIFHHLFYYWHFPSKILWMYLYFYSKDKTVTIEEKLLVYFLNHKKSLRVEVS